MPISQPMIWWMASPRNKRRNSIIRFTTASSSTRATGSVVRDLFAPATWPTHVLCVQRTRPVNGASLSRTTLGQLTPRLSGPRLACSLKPLAVRWPLATSASAFRSTPSTVCSPSILAMHTRAYSSTLTRCLRLAFVTSPSRPKLIFSGPGIRLWCSLDSSFFGSSDPII